MSFQVAPTAIGATISGKAWMVRKKPLTGKVPHEEPRQEVAEHDLAGHGEEGEAQRQPDRIEELAVEDELPVVLDPVKIARRIGGEGIPVEKAGRQHIEERHHAEDEQDAGAWAPAGASQVSCDRIDSSPDRGSMADMVRLADIAAWTAEQKGRR